MRVKINISSVSVEAELLDNPTGKKIYESLPLSGEAQVWGQEIYFKIPLHTELDSSASETVEEGNLGFWPSGDCFCLFFGQQPVSAVNVFGKIEGELDVLNEVKQRDKITVEKA